MREIDVSNCELISAGKAWDHEQDPCTKEMIKLLERKENYCYWFQPFGKGVEFQFPVMEVKGRFYQLSLRIQKAIFRHIRLNSDFQNIETIPDGRKKLRIPTTLLEEKRRTSSRFSRNMKAKQHIQSTKNTKDVNTMPTPSPDQFVMQTIVPFFALTQQQDKDTLRHAIAKIPNIEKIDTTLPECTNFIFDEFESASNMVTQLQQDCPSIMESEDIFIETMKSIYQRVVNT